MPERILIVDDERAIAQLTALWLEQAGYATSVCHDGRSGIAAAAEAHPDLLILDIRMPDMDGFEVNRHLKGTPGLSDIPVIFLSAHAQESTREEARSSGASRFLCKPYEAKDLIGAARAALSEQHVQSLCGSGA